MAKKRSNFRIKIEYYAVRAVLGTVGLFPLKFSMRLGQTAGKIIGSLIPKLKKTAHRNLELAFPELPEKEKSKIISGTFETLGRHLGFVSHFKKISPEKLRKFAEFVDENRLYEAQRTGRGILFFTGHFGSWEVYPVITPLLDMPLKIVVRRIDNPLVENFVDSLRTRFGSQTLDKKQSARKMFRILENGECLGILADLNAQEREGVFVDFFGIPASTTTSIAKLALKTNPVILPAFAVWNEEKQKYLIYIDSPVEIDENETIESLTQKITNIVEKYVRRYPEQWLWIHKRWNTRPAGEPDLYKVEK